VVLEVQATASDRAGAPLGWACATRLVAIGGSTGGTQAIRQVLERLPANCPPIAIVQHIPVIYSEAFAANLDRTCPMRVRQARDGDRLLRGLALVAPGNRHMRFVVRPEGWCVRLDDSAPATPHRPSVDVLFASIARARVPGTVGVLLTGMGQDGARGLLAMRQAGAHTIAQDEATSVVYGMPGAAVACGAAGRVLPLSHIAAEIMEPRTAAA